jgi:hypothetical protein
VVLLDGVEKLVDGVDDQGWIFKVGVMGVGGREDEFGVLGQVGEALKLRVALGAQALPGRISGSRGPVGLGSLYAAPSPCPAPIGRVFAKSAIFQAARRYFGNDFRGSVKTK